MATGSPALSGPAPRPVLVLGWGNRSRGDDALGPELLDRLQRWLETAHPARAHQVDWLEDYQLQIEHTLDLKDRRAVLLLDAAVGLDTPVAWRTVQPRRDRSLSTHALSPETLLQIFEDVHGQPAPPCELLLMQAQAFALGQPPQPEAWQALALAETQARAWLLTQLGDEP